MGRILGFLFLLFLIFVGVGFYLQWFTISLSGENKGFHVNFFVDKDKMEKDKEKATKEIEKEVKEVKDKTSK